MRGVARSSVAWVSGMLFSALAIAEPAQSAAPGGTGFSTMLDVLIGFSTVMLILSLIVTTLVQMTQSAFKLRARNLRVGIESFLKELHKAGKLTRLSEADYTTKALELLDRGQHFPGLVPKTWFTPWRKFLEYWDAKVPQISWITKGELADGIWEAFGADITTSMRNEITRMQAASETSLQPWMEKLIDKKTLEDFRAGKIQLQDVPNAFVANRLYPILDSQFDRFEAMTTNRFEHLMRWRSVIWALIVAVVFQVSAIELAQTLSSSDDLRQRAVAAGLNTLGAGELQYQITFTKREAASILNALTSEHPDLLNGNSWTKELEKSDPFSVVELEAIADAHLKSIVMPETQLATERAFTDFKGDVNLAVVQKGADKVREYTNLLSELDISPWSRGVKFYFPAYAKAHVKPGDYVLSLPSALPNWIGVMITAAFISLGAPFWFNMLKNASKLRDAIRTADPDNKQNA